jgi:predicted secreted Zn-dependent protease
MLARLLLILLVFPSAPFTMNSGDENLIPWKFEKKLIWNDFQGSPPANATNAALTSSTILINFNYSNTTLNFDIKCAFDKSKSWVRIKNDHILGHEQGHFDITEVHARKLYKRLKEYQFRKGNVSADINEIYQGVVNELQVMQNKYDKETDHSRNYPVQKEWEVTIAESLNEYKNFTGYSR